MLPTGLELCRWCGTVRGATHDRVSRCLCDGVTCQWCGVGRIRRPISDYYEPRTGKFWHVPYFGGWAACSSCHEMVTAITGESASVGGEAYAHPRVVALREALKGAGAALSRPGTETDHDGPCVVAVHGDREAWGVVAGEPPPDSRPLWVGIGPAADLWPGQPLALLHAGSWATSPAQTDSWIDEHITTASWSCPDGELMVHVALGLAARWRPPMLTGAGEVTPRDPSGRFRLRCPRCASWNVLPIVYGYPDPFDLGPAADRGEIVQGGCLEFQDSPSHQCGRCDATWRYSSAGLPVDIE